MSDFDFSFSKSANPVEIPPVMQPQNPFQFAKHACAKCSKKFETKFLLNLHCVTRCPKLPYSCDGCELRFSNLANSRSHQKICKKVPREKASSKTGTRLTTEEDPGKSQTIHPKKKDLAGFVAKDQQSPDVEEPAGKKRQPIQPKPSTGSKAVKPQIIYVKEPNEEDTTGSKSRKRQSIQQKQLNGSKDIKRQKIFVKELSKEEPKGSNARKNSGGKIKVPKVERPSGSNGRKQQKKHMILPEDDSNDEKPFGIQSKDEDSADSSDRGNVTKRGEMVPLTCKICRLTFLGRRRMDRHMRIHSDKKAYQCDKCHLGFYWKSNFERHLRIECGAKTLHECEKCFQLFSRKFSLLRHYQTKHAENGAEISKNKDDSVPNQERGLQDQNGEDTRADSDQDVQDRGQETEADSDDDAQDDCKEDTEVASEQNSDTDERNRYKVRKISSNPRSVMEHNKNKLSKNGDSADQEPKRRKKRKIVSRRYKCDICNLWFMWKCDLNRHRITHSSNKAYPCDKCELGFNWKSNLTRHQRNTHYDKPTYRCDNCGESFVKSHHLARHVSNYCDKRHHLRSRPLNRPRKCKEEKPEESSLLNSQTLNSFHRAADPEREQEVVIKAEPDSSSKTIPEEIRPDSDQHVNIVYLHVCQKGGYDPESSCGDIQSTSGVPTEVITSDLSPDTNKKPADRPIKTEDEVVSIKKEKNGPQKEFVCSKCSRVFYRKTCHVQHERSHNRQPIKCQWCGREFLRKSLFDKHVQIHTVEKPFSCEICPAYFRLQSQMVTHLKSHTGEKPFECEFCKGRFSRMSLLERHRMTHTGERPFKCEYCDLAFIQKCSLVLHQKVHVGDMPYRCGKCGVRFVDRSSYDRHMDRVHAGSNAETFFRRKHKRRDTAADQHIYNTRFAQRVNFLNVDQDEEVDDPISHKKIKYEDASDVEDNEYDVEYLESIDVRSKRRLSRNSNRSSLAATEENSDYCEVIEEKVLSDRKRAGKAVDQRGRDNGRNHDNGVLVKNIVSHKDINSYKSESINEFLKSYTSKNTFKGKGMRKNRAWYQGKKVFGSPVRTKGEMSRIREAMSALGHFENENGAAIEIKKCKDAKSKLRRCSKEMEISEGLENFHIGPCKVIIPGVTGNDCNTASQEPVQTANDVGFVEGFSGSTTGTSEVNYETQHGGYIFQDIITVEAPTTSINLKCDEDFESRQEAMSRNNEDQEHNFNRKSLHSVCVQSSEVDGVVTNSQKTVEKSLEYKEAIKIDDNCEIIEEELKNQEINQIDENDLTLGENTDGCYQENRVRSAKEIDEEVTANESGKCIETANIIRVRKCLTNLNAKQKNESSKNIQELVCQMENESYDRNNFVESLDPYNRLLIGLKQTVDCQKIDPREALSQLAQCENSIQNQHEGDKIIGESKEDSDEKIYLCKDDEVPAAIFIHGAAITKEETQDAEGNPIRNTNHEMRDSFKKSIVDEDFKSGEAMHLKPVEDSGDFELVPKMGIRRCQVVPSSQYDGCQPNIEVYEKELDNGLQVGDTCVGNKENDSIGHVKNHLFPDAGGDDGNFLLEEDIIGKKIEETDIVRENNIQKDPSIGDVKSFEITQEMQVGETNDHYEKFKVDKFANLLGGAKKECNNVTRNDESNCIQENVIGTSSDTPYDTHNDESNRNRDIDDDISNTSLESHNGENNVVNHRISNDFRLDGIQNDNTGLMFEVSTDKELIPVAIDVNGDHTSEKCVNNYEETNPCPSTEVILEIITDNDATILCKPDRQAETPILNNPDKFEEKEVFQQSNTIHALRSGNQSIQFRSINSSSSALGHEEDNFDEICEESKLSSNAEPISRKDMIIGPNNRVQDMSFDQEPTGGNQVEVQNNPTLNCEHIDTAYTEAGFAQNNKTNVCLLNVNSEKNVNDDEIQTTIETDIREMHNPYPETGMERNQVPILNMHTSSEQNFQPTYGIDKDLPTRYETNERPIQYKVQFEHCSVYQNYETDSTKNMAPHVNNELDLTLHKNDQTFQFLDQITPDHPNSEVPSNYQVRYETDIDEETIRYAVQTVQAIIQSEVPMCRETVQVSQAPVQYHGQEIIRYETQSFQVPFRYGTSFQHGYDVHPHPIDYQSILPSSKFDENAHREVVHCDVSNPFRYSYVGNENVQHGMSAPIHPRGVVDYGKLVHYKEACSTNYPTQAVIKQDSVVYKGHEEIGFEEVFPAIKPMSDLIPNNRNSDFVSYEKTSSMSSMPNQVHSLVPYESVEVSETVYTNLDLSSYGRPPTVAYVPYKEVFIDKGVIHKGQRSIDQNVLFSDAHSYANTSEKFYSFPFRSQAMNAADTQQSQISIDYEESHPYTTHQEKNFRFLQDFVPETVVNEEQNFAHHDFIPINQPMVSAEKEFQASSVSGQYSRVEKKIHKNIIRPEVLVLSDPKKNRVPNKRIDYVDFQRQEKSTVDFGRHTSADSNKQRSSYDHGRNAFFDQASKKTIDLDQDINNPNSRIRMISHGNSPSDNQQNSSCTNEIGISEKSIECDKCSRLFHRKNDLIRHRFTEHDKVRPYYFSN